MAVGVLHGSQSLHQPPGGVGGDGGVHGVGVPGGGLYLHVDVEQTLDAHGDLAGTALFLFAALPDVAVALDQIGMGLGKGSQVGRADLLLAFENQLHIAGQLAVGLQPCVDGAQAGGQAVLVVGHAPGIDDAVPDLGGKGIGEPLVQGLHRLDVIVVVAAESQAAFALDVRVDNGVAVGGDQGGLNPVSPHFILHQLDHLRDALAGARQTGLAAQVHKQLDVLVPVGLHVIQHLLKPFRTLCHKYNLLLQLL